MSKTTAIIITIATALLCGCPGLAVAGIGVMAALGSQMPDVMAQNANAPQDVLLGSGIFLCFGGLMILIPVIVGFLSIRFARSDDADRDDMPTPPFS